MGSNALDDLLPVREIEVSGTVQDFVSKLDLAAGFTTSTTTDPATGAKTLHVNAGSATVHEETASYNVSETSGVVYVGIKSLGADAIVRAPASTAPPTAGMQIIVAVEDASLSSHNVIFDGNGNNVQVGNASNTTYTMTKANWGDGGSITFLFTGTIWKAI